MTRAIRCVFLGALFLAIHPLVPADEAFVPAQPLAPSQEEGPRQGEESAREIEALIDRLGDPSDASGSPARLAEERLRELGAAAVIALERACVSENRLLAERASRIARQMRQADPQMPERTPQREAAGASGPADTSGGLLLSARAEVEPRDDGIMILLLTAVFENRGDAPLKIFVPEGACHIAYPGWHIVHVEGGGMAPVPQPFSRVSSPGPIGEVVTLAPGATHEILIRVQHLAWDFSGAPDELTPGTYQVYCSLLQEGNVIPWQEETGRGARPVEGLWTGNIQSASVSLTIPAAEEALPSEW